MDNCPFECCIAALYRATAVSGWIFSLRSNINHSQIKTPKSIDDLVSFVVATQIASVHLVTCGRRGQTAFSVPDRVFLIAFISFRCPLELAIDLVSKPCALGVHEACTKPPLGPLLHG